MSGSIDIGGILKASKESEAERTKPVCVAIYVDLSAPDHLVSLVRRSFTPVLEHATLRLETLDQVVPAAPSDVQLALIVAGVSPLVGEFHRVLGKAGVPSIVICESLKTLVDASHVAGSPISPLDIVFLDEGETGASDGEDRFLLSLGELVCDRCKDHKLALASAFPFMRKPAAIDIVRSTSMQNAVIGAVVIIPGANMPVMTLNQAKMILQIAAVYEQQIGPARIKELAAVVGGGFALRALARQIVGIVPVLGWAVKGAIGYSGTIAMGYAAIEYFAAGGDILSLGQHLSELGDTLLEKQVADAGKRQVIRDTARRARERLNVDLISVTDASTGKIENKDLDK